MKHARIVIEYVLKALNDVEINQMKMTLEILLKLMDKLPDYYADDVLTALLEVDDAE